MKVIKPIAITEAALVSTTATDTTPAYSAGTTYAADAQVQLAHRLYRSVQANNLNHAPATDDGTWWIDVGATNDWAMFDDVLAAPTSATDTLTVVLAPGYVDSLALLEVEASEVTVVITDGAAGPEVYRNTVSLIDGYAVSDWYEYFFSPIERRREVTLLNLPPYYSARVTITLTGAGTVKCGALVLGAAHQLGAMRWGARAGITDYSRVEFDPDFGTARLVRRNFAKRMELTLSVDTVQLNRIQRVLADLRALPCVWIGVDRDPAAYTVFIVYGVYRDFQLELEGAKYSLCSLEIKGLV